MTNWLKKIKIDWGLLFVILLGLVFLGAYSYLARQLPADWSGQPADSAGQPKLILNSPDETANLFFARHFAQTNSLSFVDPANAIAGELVSPRSMRVINGQTAPAGFIGLPIIYGTLAKVFGLSAIPFFTPILAIIGIIFFYLTIKKLFGRETAMWSSLFAYLVPAYWYYSTKGLMPNVAFMVFFIMALYFFLQAINKKQLVYYLLLGAFLGLSLMVRTSEIAWLGPLFLALTLLTVRQVKWPYLFCSLAMTILFFSPVMYFNQQIYNSPFSFGYATVVWQSGQSSLQQGLSLLSQIFLPFGFNVKLALGNFYHYSVVMFPLWSILMGGSFILANLLFIIQKKWQLLVYSLLLAFFGFYLIVYYGSWLFNDNPDPQAITIGTSYVRYWLPLYLFSLPYPGWLISVVLKRFAIARPAFGLLIFTSLFFVSYPTVMLEAGEGIYQVNKNIQEYQLLARVVFEKTETNAVIIAGRLDKVFFPIRSVIYKLNKSRDYDRIKELINGGYPVYYFDFTLQPADLAYLNQTVYQPHGLSLTNELLKFGKQSLYKIEVK